MAAEPTTAPDEAQDPETDTPENAAEEPGEDTPQPEQQVDYKARWEEAQQLIGRQGQELGLLRRGERGEVDEEADDEGEPDEGEPSRSAPDPYLTRLEGQSWTLAENLYGQEALDAYDVAYRVLSKAETPADYIAAFEAYHELRSGGASPEPEAAKARKGRSRAEAIQPRVDANRSDAGPDPSAEVQLEAARKKGGPESLGAFVSAATRAMGFKGNREQPGR